jgi:hypothetical protein
MDSMIRRRVAKYIAWFMGTALVTPYVSSGAVASATAREPLVTQTVIVFPIDNAAGSAGANVADAMTACIHDGFVAREGYRVIAYSERLPAVQRLAKLDPDKASLIAGPFHTDARGISNAVMLAKPMLADLVVVGSLDRYAVSDQGVAELGVSVDLIDAETGNTVRSVTATGYSGKILVSAIGQKLSLADQAVADAGGKVVSAITGQNVQTPTATNAPRGTVRHSGKSKQSWLALLLLAIGAGVLIGNGHSSGSSSGDVPPGPPF